MRFLLWKNGTGLYAKLQKWFSGKNYSHTAIYLANIDGKDWVYEAGFSLSANPVNIDSSNIEVWETNLRLQESLMEVIDRVNGRSYAFLQILYFVRRKFYESAIGKPFWWIRSKITGVKKVTKLNNWFPRSQICTEFWHDVVKGGAQVDAPDLYTFLDTTYDGNNLYVSDVLDIMNKFPQYFWKIK